MERRGRTVGEHGRAIRKHRWTIGEHRRLSGKHTGSVREGGRMIGNGLTGLQRQPRLNGCGRHRFRGGLFRDGRHGFGRCRRGGLGGNRLHGRSSRFNHLARAIQNDDQAHDRQGQQRLQKFAFHKNFCFELPRGRKDWRPVTVFKLQERMIPGHGV